MSTPASRHVSGLASSGEGLLGFAPAGAVLSFRTTSGWGNVPGNWAASVSTQAATFEAWIRTAIKDPQTIVLGSNSPGATPRISVGGDRISVYWNTGGDAPGWTSADTAPVTDGRWHHIAVVFDQGAITFYKDGVATTDQLSVGSAQQAAGDLQLGAGFGATTGFTGQMYGVRVWSVARTAQQIAMFRWAPVGPPTAGLTVAASFDPGKQEIVNQVGGGTGSVSNGRVVTTDLPVPAWALSFSGDPQGSVEMGNISGLSTTAATFECWMKMSTAAGVAGSAQTLICQGMGGPQLAYMGDDKLSVSWLGNECDSADTRPVSDGAWHHVAVVFDHGYVTLYKDGVATADSFQVPDPLLTGTALVIGNNSAALPHSPFDGELYDVRVWTCARTASEVSSFRYATLQGSEPGLVALSGYRQATTPVSIPSVVNLANGEPGTATGTAAVVPVPQAPLPQAPSPVWTYELAGEAPVGPVLTAQGLLCTDNNASGAGSAFLRSVDLQTGQADWSYDVRAQSDQSSIVVPSAVGVYGQTALVGVQTTDKTQVEVHAVDVATGAPAWPKPAVVVDVNNIITRPVVVGGTLYAGVQCDNFGTPGVMWGDAATGGLSVNWATNQSVDAMTTPVTDGDNVYVGINDNGTAQVYAIPSDADGSNDFVTWSALLGTPITADLTLGSTALFVPNGTTMLALDLNYPNFGSTLWSQPLSGSVNSQPVLLGSTLYVGCDDGTLYALDAATGTVQWQVDTRSPISTGLANEDGVLYFATAGDDAAGPAFWAVDTNSGGNDVLSYPVPGAGTIAFDQGGMANGVVYFYGTPDSAGANLVYAVNMSAVIHEFAVNSKLIVENYDTTTSNPKGSDTSYRVTLTIRDENGLARPGQAVKLWTTGTLSVVNQSSPVTLAPDSPAWMETDTSGNLTLALSAYDNGQPGGGTTGSPNLACPPLFAWSTFMAAGEAIVIYPDHESLTQLSNVQGTTTSADGAVQGSGTAAVPLDQATGYDGSPLISSAYRDPDSLTAIAATVRNTVGTRTTTSVTGSRLAGRHPAQKYVRAGGVLPNVVYAPDATAAPTRPYVPGAEPVFTAALPSGKPAVYTAGTYDPTRPASLQAAGTGQLGGVFSDIEHFKNNVIHGAEMVAKMAWKYTENAVTTVIHTAESEYDLAITDLEDAVTAVAGFFKSVVDDIKKAIQWLSALFNFENILKNHAYIKNAITNPTDPSNPGILDRMATWVHNELNGTSTDSSTVLGGLTGQASAAVGSSAQGTAGQTVQSQQNGNNDPNTVYNHGGNNNANQCTWMHQKVNENAAGGSVGAAALGASWDSGTVIQAFEDFLSSIEQTLKQSFADFPGEIHDKLASTVDSFKDPKSLLSTGLSDLLTVFQTLGDNLVKFAQAAVADFMKLADTLLGQIAAWLDQPVNIPFVSNLYKALTGDQLSLLDLLCLLAAVPATILLAVLTGSPTVPDDETAGSDLTSAGGTAGRIILGIAGYCIGQVSVFLDALSLQNSILHEKADNTDNLVSAVDFGADFISYSLGMVVAFGWSAWEAQDWVFWGLQFAPQAFNFGYLVGVPGGTYEWQVLRDALFGTGYLIMAAVWAHDWPDGYLNAPKAKGLPLTANIFNFTSSITEFVLVVTGKNEDVFDDVAIAKVLLYSVGNLLNFVSNVLGLVA